MSPIAMLTFDGFTAEEILSLPDETLHAEIVSGAPMVVRIGSADVLCRFWEEQHALVLELGHVDGGGEGVLPAIAVLARRFAVRRGLRFLDWRVHAVTCRQPNLKLRRLLERRGFRVVDVPGTGVCYHMISEIGHGSRHGKCGQ